MPTLRPGVDEFIENFDQNTGYAENVFAATANNLYGNINNWSLGHVPAANERARIPFGQTCTFNGLHTVAPYCLRNDGSLKAINTVNTKLTVRHFMNFGYLELGLPTARIASGVKCTLEFSADALDDTPTYDTAQHGKGLLNFGEFRAHGKVKPLFASLAAPVAASATTITIVSVPAGWAIGDLLFLPDTRESNFQDSGWTPQWEYVTISSIASNVITLTAPTAFSHVDKVEWADGTIKRVEVTQLRTNLLIQSAGSGTPLSGPAAALRGHVMTLDYSRYGLSGVTFLNMGRTQNLFNPDGTPNLTPGINQKGRYPWHIHHCVWGEDVDDCVFTNEDFGSSLFSLQRWGAACHDTGRFRVRGCAFHGMSGTGLMFAEEGNEYEGLVENCAAMRIGGSGAIDVTPNGGGVGTGFHGLSHLVRVKNVRLYNAPTGYSSSVYINNRNIGATGGLDQPHVIRVPNANGADIYNGEYVELDAKSTPILEVDGAFACSQVGSAVPTFWHIGANELATFSIPESTVKNVYGFNCRQMSPIQYEMVNVTWDGVWMRNTGDNDDWWGDYTQVNVKFKNVHLAGYAKISTPAVCHGYFIIDGLYAEDDTPIRIIRWNDIYQGSKMAGRSCDVILNNVSGPARAIQMAYDQRSSIYNGGGTGNPQTDTPLGRGFNLVAPQRILVTNWNGRLGHNFLLWHDGQHPAALIPYTLTTAPTPPGTPIRSIGVWADNNPSTQTNQDTVNRDGTCAFSELMPTGPNGAVAHASIVTGKIVPLPRSRAIHYPLGSVPMCA
jgi:hypothetical protein